MCVVETDEDGAEGEEAGEADIGMGVWAQAEVGVEAKVEGEAEVLVLLARREDDDVVAAGGS